MEIEGIRGELFAGQLVVWGLEWAFLTFDRAWGVLETR